MNHDIPVRHGPRLMLALLALLIMLSSAPFASQAAVRPAPQAIGPAAQITEARAKQRHQNATPLVFTGGRTQARRQRFGAIDAASGPSRRAGGATGDWYKFTWLAAARQPRSR